MSADSPSQRQRASTHRSAGKAPWALLFSVACYFFAAGIMQSLVSLAGVRQAVPTWELGLMLGLASGGIGVVTDLGFAAYADGGHMWSSVRTGLVLAGVAAVMLSSHTRWMLLTGAALFGLGSSAMSNALLAWLSMSKSTRSQAGVQGLNGTVQRGGSLVAAGVVALGVALRSTVILALGALVVGVAAFIVLRSRRSSVGMVSPSRPTARVPIGRLVTSYVSTIKMLRNRTLMVASMLGIAINILLLSTNSYVPLVGGGHKAGEVAGALAARDVCAVLVGLIIARREASVDSRLVAGLAIAFAGVGAWLTGIARNGISLVLCTGVEGAAIAVCIAGTNLLTVGAVNANRRASGMALTNLPGRVAVFCIPLAGSAVLRSGGLGDVFRLIGALLIVLAAAVVVLGRGLRAGSGVT